jgi:hypothetical protein
MISSDRINAPGGSSKASSTFCTDQLLEPPQFVV